MTAVYGDGHRVNPAEADAIARALLFDGADAMNEHGAAAAYRRAEYLEWLTAKSVAQQAKEAET